MTTTNEILQAFTRQVQKQLVDVAQVIEDKHAVQLACYAAMAPIIGALLAAHGRCRVNQTTVQEIFRAFEATLLARSVPVEIGEQP